MNKLFAWPLFRYSVLILGAVALSIFLFPGEARGEMVRMQIEDNGAGIAPEHHERIFELFQRLEPSIQGSGIGLAIVKRAVSRLRGRIGIESKIGEGTVFWVELPRA